VKISINVKIMKQRYLIILLFYSGFLNSQIYNKDCICETDTIHSFHRSMKIKDIDTFVGFRCMQPSKIGYKIEIGATSINYNETTKNWLGNHWAGTFGFILVYDNFNFGLRTKLWTVNPKGNLVFGLDTLKEEAYLNPIKLDYFISYSQQLTSNFFIEPYIGYSKNIFKVINQNDLNKNYNIQSVDGLLMGLTINKYFKNNEFNLASIYFSAGFSTAEFKYTNPNLKNGYFEYTIGIACKGFFKMTKFKRLNRKN